MPEVEQEILNINVHIDCDGKCEGCEKYFGCTLAQKDQMLLRRRMDKAERAMSRIKHKIITVGGKGGVGKTQVAVNLAMALAMRGRRVAILDQSFDGPCVPIMLGVEGKGIGYTEEGLVPSEGPLGIRVVSMGLILPEDEVVTWFHNMKRNATEEMISHVLYGDQDYLIIDVPAGTSSDTVNIIQYISDMSGAVVVTTPSLVSQAVAYKVTLLLQQAKVPVFGVLENMGTFTCPQCNEGIDIMQSGAGKRLAEKCEVPFLGTIPFDVQVADCGDDGVPFVYKHPDSEAAKVLAATVDYLEGQVWKG